MFWRWFVAAVVSLCAVGGAYLFWLYPRGFTPAPAPVAVTPPVDAAPRALPPAPVAPPAILHPVEAMQAPVNETAVLPSLDESDKFVTQALTGLLGRGAVLSFLNLDQVVRAAVATVDNLGRDHAASRLWPVLPTPGRFLVLQRGDGTYMADGNTERYARFVGFVTSVDAGRAAALYRQLYPLLQQAYEQLGYPGKYFNDRLITVIDQLLDTPEPSGPLKLTLTQVQGPIPATRPWVRYEFADPTLESRPAGQKMLLRTGLANERRLKAKMAEFRTYIATGGVTP